MFKKGYICSEIGPLGPMEDQNGKNGKNGANSDPKHKIAFFQVHEDLKLHQMVYNLEAYVKQCQIIYI